MAVCNDRQERLSAAQESPIRCSGRSTCNLGILRLRMSRALAHLWRHRPDLPHSARSSRRLHLRDTGPRPTTVVINAGYRQTRESTRLPTREHHGRQIASTTHVQAGRQIPQGETRRKARESGLKEQDRDRATRQEALNLGPEPPSRSAGAPDVNRSLRQRCLRRGTSSCAAAGALDRADERTVSSTLPPMPAGGRGPPPEPGSGGRGTDLALAARGRLLTGTNC